MNNMIKFFAVFAVGSLAGSAVTYAMLKAEYERRVTEAAEIAEERAMKRNALDSEQLKKTQGELEELREQIIHKEIKEYNDVIEKHDYTIYAKQLKEKQEELEDLRERMVAKEWDGLTSVWSKFCDQLAIAGVSEDEFREKLKEVASRYKIDLDAMIKREGSLGMLIETGLIPTELRIETLEEMIGQGKEEPKMSNPDEPYVISVEDFADMEDYEIKYLTYYADGLLADDADGDPVDDMGELAGYKFIDCFGEDDVVYVRNDRLQCDLEITRDYRTLKEVREESYS